MRRNEDYMPALRERERLEALEQRCSDTERELEELRGERQRVQRQMRRARGQSAVATLAVIGAILLSPSSREAIAQGAANLAQRVSSLENAVAALQSTVGTHTTQISGLQTTTSTQATAITTLQSTTSAHATAITGLQSKTQYVSVSGGEMFITGTNLYIRNGAGATVTNSEGNLIVGYNTSRVPDGGTDVRSGSHCLVVGDRNNYSSYGGIVVGDANTISDIYASISGGFSNTASAARSSVSGGSGNTASGPVSWAAGGFGNSAINSGSSASGGNNNVASGYVATVSGGDSTNVDGSFDWGAASLILEDG